MTNLDLEHSRPLDVHRWSYYPETNEFVDEIFASLTSVPGQRKTSKKLLKVVLLDLYVAWRSDPELLLSFSRDNNAYRAGSRYNSLHIGRSIIALVDALVEQGIVCQQKGFFDRRKGFSRNGRIWPSDELKEKFTRAGLDSLSISDHEDREVIVLRDAEKQPIEYEDTDQTLAMRSLLKDYNALIARTHVDLRYEENRVLKLGSGTKKTSLSITQHHKFVRRIFNNGRWDQGGRFYGGWWQRCPKEYRKQIMLDDIITAEVDYSGLHIVILYAQEGIDYWKEVNDDPYTVPAPEGLDPSIDLRATAKLLLLTAINAKDETSTFQAFRSQAETGSPEKRLTNAQLSAILDALKAKHKPIAHKLASGAGIDLMYVDSQITEKLLRSFTYDLKCPILSIHDSYVVPFGYDKILRDEMIKAFEDVTGVANVKVEHTTTYFDELEPEKLTASNTDDGTLDTILPYACERHTEDYKLFKRFFDKPDIEPWYPDWSGVY